jgi:uncharacterized membrane protein YidH (DUF202 family)
MRMREHRPSTEDHEPDYRFTLANERTFLAWVRTAPGPLAGGVAVDQLIGPFRVIHGRQPSSSAEVGVPQSTRVFLFDELRLAPGLPVPTPHREARRLTCLRGTPSA